MQDAACSTRGLDTSKTIVYVLSAKPSYEEVLYELLLNVDESNVVQTAIVQLCSSHAYG